MMRGSALLRWARGVYGVWFDKRHGPRELPEEMLAGVYLRGAIDALAEETARIQTLTEQGKGLWEKSSN